MQSLWYGRPKFCCVTGYWNTPPKTTDDWDKVTCRQCIKLRDKEIRKHHFKSDIINKIFSMEGKAHHEED
jgi:hypothetical protein